MLIKCECINLALEYWHTGIKKYAQNYFYKDMYCFPEMEVDTDHSTFYFSKDLTMENSRQQK